jgi:hypothetical protein
MSSHVTVKFDDEEKQLLCDLLDDQILKNDCEARLDYELKLIKKSKLNWCLEHADWLRGIKVKLITVLDQH